MKTKSSQIERVTHVVNQKSPQIAYQQFLAIANPLSRKKA